MLSKRKVIMQRPVLLQRIAGIIIVCILLLVIPFGISRDIQHPYVVREPIDTIGFATHAWQMDSVMARIFRLKKSGALNAYLDKASDRGKYWKAAICPHDDYVYAGWLYPAVLRNIKANTVILFGVAHKAKRFNLDNRLVFDSFREWQEPYGNVKISGIREEIMQNLPKDAYIVHDSMQIVEHSVEAIVPFLQYYNHNIKIVSILVPYMPFDRMNELSDQLAASINKVLKADGLVWGKDVALVMSTDAVHYGDEEWGGQNYAQYGCDSAGFSKAVMHEKEIIDNCLVGSLSADRIKRFTGYTLKAEDYKSYKWTWCGRYSVPFGLLTAMKMQSAVSGKHLSGKFVGYGTSLNQPKIVVSDLWMGRTAIATLHHWVGYAGVGYH